jgi:hypothetical protein
MANYNNFRKIVSGLCNNFKRKHLFVTKHRVNFDAQFPIYDCLTFDAHRIMSESYDQYRSFDKFIINAHPKDPLPKELEKIYNDTKIELMVDEQDEETSVITLTGVVPNYYINEIKKHCCRTGEVEYSSYDALEESHLLKYWNSYSPQKYWLYEFRMNILQSMHFRINDKNELNKINYIKHVGNGRSPSLDETSYWKFNSLNCFGEPMEIICYKEYDYYVVTSSNVPFNMMHKLALNLNALSTLEIS